MLTLFGRKGSRTRGGQTYKGGIDDNKSSVALFFDFLGLETCEAKGSCWTGRARPRGQNRKSRLLVDFLFSEAKRKAACYTG